MKQQISALILAAVLILTAFTGCAAVNPSNGTTASTTVATTVPEETTSAGKDQTTSPATTETTEKQALNTSAPEETTNISEETSAPTEAPVQNTTTPPETDPPVTTEPPSTEPPETTPPHDHSYEKTDTVKASCTEDGYTLYQCACGSSYKDDVTPATGHRWATWTVTKYPTTTEEGERICTCGYCGIDETVTIEKLPADHVHEYREVYFAATCQHPNYYLYLCECGDSYKSEYFGELAEHYMVTYEVVPATPEADGYHIYHCGYDWDGCTETKTLVLKYENQVVDTEKLAEYGRQYGKDTYGYNPVIGTRAGYYPGLSVTITSMEDGYHDVADAVDATTRQLVAAGVEIVTIIDGVPCAARLDIEVVHEGNNDYCIWVYYG